MVGPPLLLTQVVPTLFGELPPLSVADVEPLGRLGDGVPAEVRYDVSDLLPSPGPTRLGSRTRPWGGSVVCRGRRRGVRLHPPWVTGTPTDRRYGNYLDTSEDGRHRTKLHLFRPVPLVFPG